MAVRTFEIGLVETKIPNCAILGCRILYTRILDCRKRRTLPKHKLSSFCFMTVEAM